MKQPAQLMAMIYVDSIEDARAFYDELRYMRLYEGQVQDDWE